MSIAKPESRLVSKIVATIKARCPTAFVVKLSDRMTRGLPDVLAIFASRNYSLVVMALEVKTAKGKATKLQEMTLEKLNAIHDMRSHGWVDATVVRSVDEVNALLDQHL